MNYILSNIYDILIESTIEQDHLPPLQLILNICKEYILLVKIGKWGFIFPGIFFLEHIGFASELCTVLKKKGEEFIFSRLERIKMFIISKICSVIFPIFLRILLIYLFLWKSLLIKKRFRKGIWKQKPSV